MLLKRLLWLTLGLYVTATPLQAETFTVYSYHSDPPYYLPNQPIDLSRAWVSRFNVQHKDVQLRLKTITRPELNTLVKAKQRYLILWGNPLWFRSRDPDVLSSEPIFWDADIWVSQRDNPVEYRQPRDLIGHTFGGRRGYFYKGTQALINTERMRRVDQDTDYENYQALMDGDISTFVMSRSSLLYWTSMGIETKPLYIALAPHDAYTRHLLLSAYYQPLLPAVNQFIRSLKQDDNWQQRLKLWGVENLTSPVDVKLLESSSH